MHDHSHLMIQPNKNNISEIMRSIKTNSSREINKYLIKQSFQKTMSNSGATYPEAQVATDAIFEARVAPPELQRLPEFENIPKFKWQPRFHDHVIRNKNDFYNHLNYIHKNPLKHLDIKNYEDYKFSSYRYWQNLIDKYE